MSIAQLPDLSEGDSVVSKDRGARDRIRVLAGRIQGDHLGVAELILETVVAHQQAGVRGLTVAETASLARFGVSEGDLIEPTSLPAIARGQLWEQEISAHSFSVSETAVLLGVTPARVRQRCAAGTLFAQRRSDGWHLPRFQFPEDREVRGWAMVAQSIERSTPSILVERVLTSPAPRLLVEAEELSPFDWLAQGGDPVIAAAAVDDALNRLP